MSTTPTAPLPPASGRDHYRALSTLRRSRSDRKVAGVAGGLGRYAGIDPLIFRVLFVILTIFAAGSGLALYLLAWLLVPADGEPMSEGRRLIGGRPNNSVLGILAITVLVVIAIGVFGATLDSGPGFSGFGVMVVMGAVAFLLLRRGTEHTVSAPTPPVYGPVPPPMPAAPATPYGEYGQTTGTAYVEPGVTGTSAGQAAAWAPTPMTAPPPRPRERSRLPVMTLSAAALLVGLMAMWNTFDSRDFRAVEILAAALAVLGAGLVVGGFRGRARWLIFPALLLSVATAITGAVSENTNLSGGMGERVWRPLTVEQAERPFRLGAGEARLDLRELPAGADATVDVNLGLGELLVTVPDDARVVLTGGVSAGEAALFDSPLQDGTGLNFDSTFDPQSGEPNGVITIDARVGLGRVEVSR